MIDLYGIPNCDTVKKARKWLEAQNVEYTFHDYKKEGVDESWLIGVVRVSGLDKVLNRRGTTWRKLSESEQAKAKNERGAVELMLANSSLIKRPIVQMSKGYLVGFNEEEYKQRLK